MRFPSPEERSWLAGIVCGEGNIGVHRPHRFVGVRLTVGQASFDDKAPPLLLMFQRFLGAGRIYRVCPARPERNRRPQWQYYLHAFKDVQAAIAIMWRWLTPEKQAQALRSLRTYHRERAERIASYAVS